MAQNSLRALRTIRMASGKDRHCRGHLLRGFHRYSAAFSGLAIFGSGHCLGRARSLGVLLQGAGSEHSGRLAFNLATSADHYGMELDRRIQDVRKVSVFGALTHSK